MTSKLTIPQVDTVLDAFAKWLLDHTEVMAAEIVGEQLDTENVVVATAAQASIDRGSTILAVFTARAALRKCFTWFETSPGWSNEDRKEFLTNLLAEAQAAIVNCNQALYHLTRPDATHPNDTTLEAFLNGGDQ